MAFVPMKEILLPAVENKYAVGAFNIVNLEMLQAIISTAEEKRSPVILNIAQAHFPFIQLEILTQAVRSMAAQAAVPIALNLDHGLSFDAVMLAVRLGFTSVMFDGSKLSFEENIRKTAEIVKICHSVDMTVEAELGAVGGDEGGGLESKADAAFFTDPAQAAEFAERTGIDALAVAIGNSHGKYKGEPKLDFERLHAIRRATGIPLVLHGGSGLSEQDFKKAINLGIAKINIYTAMSQAALSAAQEFLSEEKQYHAYPQLMQTIQKSIAQVVAENIEIFGSADKF